MITFDEIKSHLSQKIDRLAQFVQIEERQNFFIIEYEKTKQCFIIIDIKKDTNTCTFNININEISIIIEEFDYTKIFEIRNATKIGFIPVDGKQGFLGGQSHCDFIVFDVNDFCFVELKLNATSERKIKKNREKAIEQLVSTINFFNKKLDKNYLDLNLEAYVCTPEFYPRDDATWKSLAIEFLENYGIELFESNHKICK
jgi:hypothetical protein